jgi:Tol biopolymer transport system component
MSLSPDARVGPYRVVGKLGEGGMGQVYKARDTQLDRDVALKVLPDALAADHERLVRFEREARALAALNHPNIAQVYGIVSGDGRSAPAIAMEFVDGRTLDETKTALPVDEALPIARQIAAALEAAHESGIVHRDLKPGNIKLKDDGTVKVLDFGLAKAIDPGAPGRDPSSSPTITSPATGLGVVLGTAAYMSPEQARGRAVDRRADIWAFGVVVFELLTGARLFAGETVSDTIAAVLRQDIPWDRLPETTPPRLKRLLAHCLDRDPRNRLKDAGDVRIEIDDLIGARGGNDAPASPAAAATPRRNVERAGWIAIAAASAALGWWLGSSRPAPDRAEWSQFTQLTDDAGRETMPAISPDGDSIAYAGDTAGSWDIYVRRIGGRNATKVTGDPSRDEGAPAFAPDGRTIAFHEADANGGIFIVGATGESERRITDAGFHPAWSPDGRSIAFCQERIVDPRSRVVTSAVSVVDVATGAVRVVTKGDAVQPVWSPDGTRLAYWAQVGGQRDVYTIAAAGGAPVKVTDDAALDWSVAWAPDGRHLYFASDRGGAMNLWRIPVDQTSGRARGAAEPVTGGVQSTATMPSFSSDGRKLVFSSTVSQTNPVALPFDPVAERVGAPRHLMRHSSGLAPHSVSPDGTLLVLASLGVVEDLWIGRVDGTSLRRLTDDPHRDRVPAWSPDGKEIAFYSNRTGKYEIWAIRPDGSGLRQVSQRPGPSVWYPFYDPAGGRLWATLSTTMAPITFPLTGATLEPGTELPPLTVDGGAFRPYGINRDGTRLAGAAMSPDGVRLGAGWHDLKTGETWTVREGSSFGSAVWLDDRRVVFTVDGRVLATADTSKRFRIIGGPFPFDVSGPIPPAVTPDGRTIFVAGISTEADVWMVERASSTVAR